MQQDVDRTIRLAPAICHTEDGELYDQNIGHSSSGGLIKSLSLHLIKKRLLTSLKNQKLIILGDQFLSEMNFTNEVINFAQ
jgi:hypothetical protein